MTSVGAQYMLAHPLPASAYSPLDARPPPDYGAAAGALDDSGDDDDEERVVWHHIPCEDVTEIKRELGEPGPRHQCFGCRYIGQNRAARIPDVRLKEMYQLIAEGIGISWPSALAVEVANEYESWRGIINKERDGKNPLPKWSPASILDHWYNHTADPEIIKWLDLMALRQCNNTIRSRSLLLRNPKTGAIKVDREQAAIMRDNMRMFYVISAKEVRRLAYYSEGAMLDEKAVANNGFSRKRRPVYNFYGDRSKKRQRMPARSHQQ